MHVFLVWLLTFFRWRLCHLAICLVCCRVFPSFVGSWKKTVLLLVRISWLGWVLFKREANSLGSIRWGEKLPRYLHDLIREKHGMPATSPEKPCVFFFYCFGESIQVTVVFFRDGWLLFSPEKIWKILKSDVKFSEHPPRTAMQILLGICFRCVAVVSGFNKWFRHKFESYKLILAVKKPLKRRNAWMHECWPSQS